MNGGMGGWVGGGMSGYKGVGYFYFIIKGKIKLSFASPEKEKLYIYIYDVITWNFFYKYSVNNYSGKVWLMNC